MHVYVVIYYFDSSKFYETLSICLRLSQERKWRANSKCEINLDGRGRPETKVVCILNII